MDAATPDDLPLDEITDAMSPRTRKSYRSVEHRSYDANLALDKFKGLASRDLIPSVVSPPSTTSSKPTIPTVVNNVATPPLVLHRYHFDGDTVAAAEEELWEDHGSGLETCREYRARVRTLYRRDRADGRCMRSIGQVLHGTWFPRR
jgi:hypothetical protein